MTVGSYTAHFVAVKKNPLDQTGLGMLHEPSDYGYLPALTTLLSVRFSIRRVLSHGEWYAL